MATELLLDAVTAIAPDGRQTTLPLLRDGDRDCPNGSAWSRLPGLDRSFTDVSAEMGVAVACDGQGLLWSRDGCAWTRAEGVEGTERAETVGERWFASGTGPLYTSADGITWTAANISPRLRNRGLIQKLKGLYLLVSCGRSEQDYPGDGIWSSPDGVTWTERLPAAGSYIGALCPVDDGVLAIGGWDLWQKQEPKYFRSPDGITWAEQQMNGPCNALAVCRARDSWIAVGRHGIWWSADSRNWTWCPETRNNGFTGVQRVGSRWVAYGDHNTWIENNKEDTSTLSGSLWTSTDGTRWERKISGRFASLQESHGRLVLGGMEEYDPMLEVQLCCGAYYADPGDRWKRRPSFRAWPRRVYRLCAFDQFLLAAARDGLWSSRVWNRERWGRTV